MKDSIYSDFKKILLDFGINVYNSSSCFFFDNFKILNSQVILGQSNRTGFNLSDPDLLKKIFHGYWKAYNNSRSILHFSTIYRPSAHYIRRYADYNCQIYELLDGSRMCVEEFEAYNRNGDACHKSCFLSDCNFGKWAEKNRELWHLDSNCVCEHITSPQIWGVWLDIARSVKYDLTGRSPFVSYGIFGRMLRPTMEYSSQKLINPPLLYEGDFKLPPEFENVPSQYGGDKLYGLLYKMQSKSMLQSDPTGICYLEHIFDNSERYLPLNTGEPIIYHEGFDVNHCQ